MWNCHLIDRKNKSSIEITDGVWRGCTTSIHRILVYQTSPKYSTVYWCMASNLKLCEIYFWMKKSIHLRVYLFAIYVLCLWTERGFIIVQLFWLWLKQNGLQNPIRVLRCMAKSDSYVRIRVLIMSFHNKCLDFSISIQKCWLKFTSNCTPWYLFKMWFWKCTNVIGGII